MRFWRMIGRYDAESTTYTALAGTNGTSPYTPDFSGRLIGLRGIVGGGAATSLVNAIQFKLTCNTFRPNSIECMAQGGGIFTAPAFQPPPIDCEVDQKVVSGVPITIEGRNVTADTPVTVDAQLWGMFEYEEE